MCCHGVPLTVDVTVFGGFSGSRNEKRRPLSPTVNSSADIFIVVVGLTQTASPEFLGTSTHEGDFCVLRLICPCFLFP